MFYKAHGWSDFQHAQTRIVSATKTKVNVMDRGVILSSMRMDDNVRNIFRLVSLSRPKREFDSINGSKRLLVD